VTIGLLLATRHRPWAQERRSEQLWAAPSGSRKFRAVLIRLGLLTGRARLEEVGACLSWCEPVCAVRSGFEPLRAVVGRCGPLWASVRRC